MQRLFLGLVAALIVALLPAPSFAQTQRPLVPIAASGACAPLSVTAQGTVSYDITGTWVGTITFYVEGLGGTRNALDVAKADTPGTSVNTTTANGVWSGSVASYTTALACFTEYTSGTAIVSLSAAPTGGGSGGGGGGDGALETTQLLVLAAVDAAADLLDTIADALAPESTHGNAVIATGPGILCETKTLDGSALPNVVTEGQAARVACNIYGGLLSVPMDPTGLYSPVNLEDALVTAGGAVMMAGSVRRDAAVASATTDGDNANVNTDALGLLWSRQLDPCSGVAKTFYVVDTADGTNLEIANSVASQFFYICSVNLVAAGATVVLISQDDTDGCGSPEAGLNGGSSGTTTEGWSFAANGGISLGSGASSVMKTSTAARYLCIDQSASVQLSGTISYVSAP